MSTNRVESAGGRAALGLLVGEWTEQVHVADVPAGRVRFEWALDDHYLIQRSEIPQPEFPDSLAIIACDTDQQTYTQHYFDTRGVVRTYKMGLTDRVWTLLRDEPDFSPLDFRQRFEGIFSADGNTIDGRWEASEDGGEHWELDFAMTYTRQSAVPSTRPCET